jgi:hypothetical protein
MSTLSSLTERLRVQEKKRNDDTVATAKSGGDKLMVKT